MSAQRADADSCPRCGADVPVRARFCPGCGTPLEEAPNRTRFVELPPEETEPGPVSLQRAEPRWFGVTPPRLLLSAAVGAVALAVVLVATGHWPYGLILLGLAALLLAAFLEAARRRPHDHAAARPGTETRERARSAWEEWRARSGAAAAARRLQSGLLLVETERKSAFQELGGAAHRGDGEAEAGARAALAALDRREAELRAQLEEQLALAGERIRRARLPVQETMMVLPSEPSPPPDEGDPPQPAVVPEPYPPPDEGDPPEPARIPEPTPDRPPDRPRGED